MARQQPSIVPATSPGAGALVFICEKCGKRGGDGGKNPSHRLASKLKRCLKQQYGKGEFRIVLTSCMDLCPDARIAIAVQPTRPGGVPLLLEAGIDDLNASSEALASALSGARPARRLPGAAGE